MFKKFSILLISLLLSACSSVIYDSSTSTSSNYDYKLYFDDEDVDASYKNEKYVVLEGDSDLNITSAGTYVLCGELNGSVIVDSGGEVKLIFNGVTINSDDFASVYIKRCDKATITLVENTENVLCDSNTYTQIDDNNVDALIFSKSDLVFNGSGTLTINANYKHGIVSKDDLIITGGTYNITSNGQGICGKDSLRIKDGYFNIDSLKDSLKSNNDEDDGRGYIYIAGGTFNISSGDDGLTAYNDLIIDGGTINISKCYEGLEASFITINDGDISITSSDDGINAASKTNGQSTLKINGGNLYINSEGDGIDSNGDIYISGGTLFIEGPISGGDSAFDFETDAYISGGEVLMIGQSSMAESFNEDGTSQVNLLYNLDKSYSANSTLKISVNNEVIFDKTITKQFNSIQFSSPKLSVGEIVTIEVNDDTYTYTLESISNSYGNSGFNGGGMNMPNDENRPEMPDGFNAEEDGDNKGMPNDFKPNDRNGDKLIDDSSEGE